MTGAGGSANPAPGSQADLDIDPDATREELDRLNREIDGLIERRMLLAEAARQIPTTARLGEGISFSGALTHKMADRFGESQDGTGLAQAVDGAIKALQDLHGAMCRALAAHLGADSDAAHTLNRVRGDGSK